MRVKIPRLRGVFYCSKRAPELIMFGLFALAMMLAWLLPNHYVPWPAALQDAAAFLGAATLAIYIFVFTRVYVPTLALTFFCVSLIPLLQYHFGLIDYFGDAWLAFVYILFAGLMVVAGFSLQHHSDRTLFLEIFASVIFFSSALSCLIVIRQWLGVQLSSFEAASSPGGRPFGNLGQPNHLATLLSMGLASVWLLFKRNRLPASLCLVSAVLILFGIALTQSRTSWIVLPVLLVLGSSLNLFEKRVMKVLVIMLAVFVLMVIALPLVSDVLDIAMVSVVERAGQAERLVLWKQFILALREKPLWGYGWNQAVAAQLKTAETYPVRIMAEHSHNIVLDILLWNGVLLGGAILTGIGVYLFGSFAALVKNEKAPHQGYALLCLTPVLVHSLLEFPLEYAYFLVPAGILLGYIVNDSSVSLGPAGRILCSLLIVSFFASCWRTWSEYLDIQENLNASRFQEAKIANVKFDAADNPLFLDGLYEFSVMSRYPLKGARSEEDLDLMQRVASRYPYPPTLFRYAVALAQAGKLAEAKLQFDLIDALHPKVYYRNSLHALLELAEGDPKLHKLSQLLLINNAQTKRAD